MVPGRSISRAALILVAFAVVGGIAMATVVPYFSGRTGSFLAGNTASGAGGTTLLNSGISGLENTVSGGISFAGTAGGNSNPSPSTTVLGTTTVTQVESATSTATGQANQVYSTNATGPASSGHSIEFFGNLTLSASDPSETLQRAGTVAESLGGYIAYSTFGNSVADTTVRVPYQDYQEALSQLESLGTVIAVSSSSNDVTVQYADLNATLQSLVTEQASLLKLLNQSTSVNATLDIESVLQQTDAQINSVESSILQTSQLIEYATISVDVVQAQSGYAPISIKLSATPLSGMSPLSVTFNAVVKGGEPSYFVNYNFGDGTSAQGLQLIHQFTEPGKYNVTVSATDQTGNVSLAWIVVNVTSPPAASGLAAFGAAVLGLFTRVIAAIIEVAVVVIPVGLVAYLVVTPLYRMYSKNAGKREGPTEGPVRDTTSA
jgi:hypothetical protein